MEINSIKNTNPNFGARIVIKKTGFQNLGKDLADSFEIGSRTTGLTTSFSTEATIIPSDIVEGKPFLNKMDKFMNKIGDAFKRIFGRNVKTTAIEGIDTKEVASNSAVATSGAGSISTGLGSYDAALGSAIDQSVNYPSSIYARSFPEFSVNHFPEPVLKHLDYMEHFAYNWLYNKGGMGNEIASLSSSSYSGVGATSQGIGYELLTKGKKALGKAEEAQRKLPS